MVVVIAPVVEELVRRTAVVALLVARDLPTRMTNDPWQDHGSNADANGEASFQGCPQSAHLSRDTASRVLSQAACA